jgi:hypothetical protein
MLRRQYDAESSTIRAPRFLRRRLFAILGQLSFDEHEAGRPLLSVLVVHKTGDMQPGDGFFELAESLGRDTSDIDKAWIAEVRMVFQHWN